MVDITLQEKEVLVYKNVDQWTTILKDLPTNQLFFQSVPQLKGFILAFRCECGELCRYEITQANMLMYSKRPSIIFACNRCTFSINIQGKQIEHILDQLKSVKVSSWNQNMKSLNYGI